MRRPSGVVLVLAGLSVAGYALTGPEAPPNAAPGGLENRHSITVAESRPDSSLQPGASLAVAAQARPLADSAGKAGLPVPPPRPTRKHDAARSVVLAGGAARTPVGQPIAGSGPPVDRAALTRDLQRQLQRVGCYKGIVSGVWSPSTRHAMKEFIDHMNATLPVNEPDHILLAMLQGHQEQACGQGAIMAREPARQRPETRALAAHQPPAPRGVHVNGPAPIVAKSATGPEQPLAQQPLPGRMSLAGPEAGIASPTPPKADHGKEASRSRTRKAGSAKYVPNSRRRIGAWVFHDAPVDRLLAR
jgi:hypothetical protein